MKGFQTLRNASGYCTVIPVPTLAINDQLIEGRAGGLDLTCVKFQLAEAGTSKKIPDIFAASNGLRPILSERAFELLERWFVGCGRFHEISVGGVPYFFHDTEPVDCLDEAMSTSRYNTDDGSLAVVYHPVFHLERLTGRHVFCLPRPFQPVYVSGEFSQALAVSGLTGAATKELGKPFDSKAH